MSRRRTQRTGTGRVTLADVGRVAGVSSITVSRVIRTPDMVSEGTRKLVLDAIDQVGYIPNLAAGALASQRSRTAAAIVPTLKNSIFAVTLQGLMERLNQEGYQLIIGSNDFDLRAEERLVKAFMSRQVDAMVLTGRNRSPTTERILKGSNIPVVELWTHGRKEGVVTVGFSNFDASYAMVQRLVERGYREIGFVSAPVGDNDRALARREGYLAAVRDFDLNLDPARVLTSPFALEAGGSMLRAILEAVPRTDAVFFANDTLAAGAILEANRSGLDVPGRVAIAGFDDLEIAGQLTPALTTVRVPRRELGWEAGSRLLEALQTGLASGAEVDLGFTLIERAST